MGRINAALTAWAGLMGACGVASAAVAAHAAGAEKLADVALVLLAHAAALLALTQRTDRLAAAAALVMALGASLFAADVTLFTLRGAHLFPMAAPLGGMTLMLSWLMVFVSGVSGFRRR